MTDTVVPLQARRIRPAVYTGVDMDKSCPTCHAEPGQWCRRADGVVRRLPCIARTRPVAARPVAVVAAEPVEATVEATEPGGPVIELGPV